ncbi:hypothetical protein C8Q79DRAFT_1006479 [Trametes meyenii]|nr:hypothetical protein C8Q79DRAFT_1006479 [Trametes meyenii]
MPSSSDNAEVPTSETLEATIDSSTSENCEKLEEKQKPKLPDETLSSLPTASTHFTREALSTHEQEQFIQVRKKMVAATSHFETAQSIESSCAFYGRIEWLALCSIIDERREKERRAPEPNLKRKRHSSGHSESAASDSGGESDRTEIMPNHSGDLDYHPSGAHESPSDREASELVNSDSLSGPGRPGRPKKKARSGNSRRASVSKGSGPRVVGEPEPSGSDSEASSSRITGAMTISVRNEGDHPGGAEHGPIAEVQVHAAAPIPASEILDE